MVSCQWQSGSIYSIVQLPPPLSVFAWWSVWKQLNVSNLENMWLWCWNRLMSKRTICPLLWRFKVMSVMTVADMRMIVIFICYYEYHNAQRTQKTKILQTYQAVVISLASILFLFFYFHIYNIIEVPTDFLLYCKIDTYIYIYHIYICIYNIYIIYICIYIIYIYVYTYIIWSFFFPHLPAL